MTVYFTSDTHFGHNNIIKYDKRPFIDIEYMTKEMIGRWNSTVSPNDIVYHLGDFSFYGPNRTEEIFYSLNGNKHLVRGNHDNTRTCNLPWASVNRYLEVSLSGVLCCLMHFPIESWNKMSHGSLMLHGHSHGKLKRKEVNRFDVGCMLYNYRPTPINYFLDRQVNNKRPEKR